MQIRSSVRPNGPSRRGRHAGAVTQPPKPIHIVLADDHAVLRAGLHALLAAEPDLDVVGEVGTGEEAVAVAHRVRPDVVVMDLAMPGIGGLEALRQIVALGQGSKVVALTGVADEHVLLEVLAAGGSACVLKTADWADLMRAVRAAARGEAFFYPGTAGLLRSPYPHDAVRGSTARARKPLTPREREVLSLTTAGYSAADTAARLHLSRKTVETYLFRIRRKLGLSRRSDLVRFALRTGLLKPPS